MQEEYIHKQWWTIGSKASVGNWEKVLEPFSIDDYSVCVFSPCFLCFVLCSTEVKDQLVDYYPNKFCEEDPEPALKNLV